MVIALTECKGARRAVQSTRPHCFEILLKTGTLQLAAPDEYVASEWLQTLVQSASGLFELQERHKTLGCTLIITSNHMITLREDFSSPLRRLNSVGFTSPAPRLTPGPPSKETNMRKLSISTTSDIFNEVRQLIRNSCFHKIEILFFFSFFVDLLESQYTYQIIGWPIELDTKFTITFTVHRNDAHCQRWKKFLQH